MLFMNEWPEENNKINLENILFSILSSDELAYQQYKA